MSKLTLAALFFHLLLIQSAMASEKLPADVVQYVERRESCDHWRGEDGYDQARQAEIKQALCQSCPGSDAGFVRLTKKYKTNKRVLARLADFEPKIEPETAAERKTLCQGVSKGQPTPRAAPSSR
jgi:hypothetical protein